jgi:hypothetical protein
MNPDPLPKTNDPEAKALGVWGTIIVLGGIALFLGGGGLENFRSLSPAGLPEAVELPVGLEPQGLIERPPTTFRWSLGGGDPDLTQIVIYDMGFDLIWQSRPLPPEITEWEVPESAFVGALAGRKHFWRVRQVAGGKPHASSDVVEFIFKLDTRGLGPGDEPPDRFLK